MVPEENDTGVLFIKILTFLTARRNGTILTTDRIDTMDRHMKKNRSQLKCIATYFSVSLTVREGNTFHLEMKLREIAFLW